MAGHIVDNGNDEETIEIWRNPSYEVYDPWTAQVRAVCHNEQDAKRIAKLFRRLKKKTGDRYA